MSALPTSTLGALLAAALAAALSACVSLPPPVPGGGASQPRRAAGDDALVYLPFPAGARSRCVQEGPGPWSHQGSQRYAVDFAMPVGSPVVAARAGVVVAIKEDSNRGGSSRAYASEANFVRIRHADGTHARYLHLRQGGALVAVGQTVRRGQLIAYSGSTGWSTMPHLHLQIDRYDPACGQWQSIPVRFADVRGDGKPDFLWIYVSGNGAVGPEGSDPGAPPG